jgi:hypothetical protein
MLLKTDIIHVFREVVYKIAFSMKRSHQQYEKWEHQEVKTAAVCVTFYSGIDLDGPR